MPATKHEVQSFDCHPIPGKKRLPSRSFSPRSSFYRHPTAFSADHSVWKCDTWSWTIGQPAGHSNPVCRRSSPCILPNLHPGSGSERPTNEAGRGSKILYWCRRPALCWLIPPQGGLFDSLFNFSSAYLLEVQQISTILFTHHLLTYFLVSHRNYIILDCTFLRAQGSTIALYQIR